MKSIRPISISKQFYSLLKESILKGNYDYGDKLPSIRNFAQEYKISKTTVSATVAMLENEGIVDVIQGKGIYVRHKSVENKMIGVMLFNFQEETKVEAGILKGIQQNLDNGYILSMLDTANHMDVICRNADYLIQSGTQGLIILLPKCPEADEHDIEKLKRIIGDKVPVTFLLRDIECPNSDFVSVNFGKGIYEAVDYLLKAGKRNIALFLHDYQAFALQEIEAYKKAHHDNQCLYHPGYIQPWTSITEAHAFMDSVIEDVDALIASDHLIYTMRDIIYNRSKKSGKDAFYLVSINNALFAGLFNCTALTIKFPGEIIGEKAIAMLTDRMEKRVSGEKNRRVIEAQFTI